jgi:hypothetical protein
MCEHNNADGGPVVRETDPNSGGGEVLDIEQSTVFANDLLVSIDDSTGNTHPPGPLDPFHIEGIWVTECGAPDVTAEDVPVNHVHFPDSCGHDRTEGSDDVHIHPPLGDIVGIPIIDTSPTVVSPNVEVGTTVLQAAIHLSDEPAEDAGIAIFPPPVDPDPVVVYDKTLTPTYGGGTPTPQQKQEGIDNGYNPESPPPQEIEEIAPPPADPLPPPELTCDDCGGTPVCPNYSPSCQLSPNFTLGHVSTNAVLSKYAVQAQAGLTKDEIVCNLKNLCVNILEVVKAQYPNMIITSGFRHGNGRSQHQRGQASDVQFTGFTFQEYWDAAQWVKDNVNYDQFILEYGRKPWFHLSFDCEGNRGQVLTRTRPGVYKPGLIRLK